MCAAHACMIGCVDKPAPFVRHLLICDSVVLCVRAVYVMCYRAASSSRAAAASAAPTLTRCAAVYQRRRSLAMLYCLPSPASATVAEGPAQKPQPVHGTCQTACAVSYLCTHTLKMPHWVTLRANGLTINVLWFQM